MTFDYKFACDQLSSTNHRVLLDVSSSASCQHILTMCIHSCTYMDTLPLIDLLAILQKSLDRALFLYIFIHD